jgi:inosine-uridine nucleoside N-ribohydrolase
MMRFHIDTDMGVDDLLALVVASRVPNVQLVAISTVFGNVPVDTSTRNACLFRHLGQYNVPIFRGAECATDGFRGDAVDVFGDDGLGLAVATIDKDLLQAAANSCPIGPIPARQETTSTAEPITIVGIGPATNIPELIAYYGAKNVSRIVLMSGAFFDVGNSTPEAEFNAHRDPFALQVILNLQIPVTFVPLDVCRKVLLSRGSVRSYLDIGKSPLMNLVVESHMRYMDYCFTWAGIDGCFPHDAIAVLAASKPEGFFRLRGRVYVDANDPHRGRTRITPDESSNIEVIMGGDLKWVRNGLRLLQF